MSDQTSLDLLNDIVVPPEVSWWPVAPGWYVFGAALGLAFLALAWRAWKKWKQNQYRRLALQELALIRASNDGDDGDALGRIPSLLKRTALSAWPRHLVASLSGADWHQFLDRTGGGGDFGSGAGQLLDRLSYGSDPSVHASAAERQTVLKAAEHWIRRHVPPDHQDKESRSA